MDLYCANVTCYQDSLYADILMSNPADLDMEDRRWCAEVYEELTDQFRLHSDGLFCSAEWDVASCWPPSHAGELAVVPCYTDFRGVSYTYTTNDADTHIPVALVDIQINYSKILPKSVIEESTRPREKSVFYYQATASRQCFPNGTWSDFNNYTDCLANQFQDPDAYSNNFAVTLNQICTFLHYFGYSLSFTSCLLAIVIYARFRSLCRLRNVIHLNLIMTYVLSAVVWVTMTLMHLHGTDDGIHNTARDLIGMIVVFTYAQMTTFFWALCEGIYMTCILFRPHKLEQMTYWPFGVLGWIFPGIIIIIWTAVKFTLEARGDWFRVITVYNYIFIVPIFVALAINLVLLIIALYTILQRQTSSTRNSTSKVGRGVRSFLILLPLLGLTYVIIIVLPSEPGVLRAILQVLTTVLVSTQGFFVSVMYCFCNRQVRGLLKFHCYRRLAALGCHRRTNTPDDDNVDNGLPKEYSSQHQSFTNRNFNRKKFSGNTNELQYMLKAKKSSEKLQRSAEARTESLRLSRTLSNRKIPIVAL